MKFTSALILLFGLSAALPALWADTNTFPGTGNVGIGTMSPFAKLSVNGDVSIGGFHAIGTDMAFNRNVITGAIFDSGAYAYQWHRTTSTTNTSDNLALQVYNNSGSAITVSAIAVNGLGNVGIGTATPAAKLDLNGSLNINGGLTNTSSRPTVVAGTLSTGEIRGIGSAGSTADDGFLRISAGGGWTAGQKSYIDISGYSATVPSMDNQIVFGTYGTERMRITNSGKIGIGTTAPGAMLSVAVPSAGSGNLITSFGSSAAERIRFYDESSTYGPSIRSNAGNPFLITGGEIGSGAPLALGANGTEYMRIVSGGNVGIGTTSPTHKLAVNGTIRAKEVIVDTGWSDYVFDPAYRLAPLSEVEQHIKAEGHLPGIPSAREVAEHGVSMGEMQSKLLAKIEELTLHQIAQEKAIAVLSRENASLRSRVGTLENNRP